MPLFPCPHAALTFNCMTIAVLSSRLARMFWQAVDAGLSKSRQSYIIEAVKQRLAADGIPEPAADDPEGTP